MQGLPRGQSTGSKRTSLVDVASGSSLVDVAFGEPTEVDIGLGKMSQVCLYQLPLVQLGEEGTGDNWTTEQHPRHSSTTTVASYGHNRVSIPTAWNMDSSGVHGGHHCWQVCHGVEGQYVTYSPKDDDK